MDLLPEDNAPDSQQEVEVATLRTEMEEQMHKHLRPLTEAELDDLDAVFEAISIAALEIR